jgi:hypothetical protein
VDAPYDLSFSAGAIRFSGDETVTLQELLAKVDKAMYEEKWSKKEGDSPRSGLGFPAGKGAR